jgi:hypothetical protein
MTDSITPWSRILLEKLIVARLVKNAAVIAEMIMMMMMMMMMIGVSPFTSHIY